ncbi:ABC transporter permease [uncultured Stenotrophomonas sp.]|uniref:ABC transporter permease n=1 Tax=uncultured Stenotrophomonas sp. TaxID=165438 RepID=UPI0026003789|nr:ABC transporter permease [uncultured Stenotrophomonas sp.]
MFESMRETRRHLGCAALLAVQAALASLACAFALQSTLDSFARLNTGCIREAVSIGVVRVSDVEDGADAAVLRADLSAIRLPGVQDTVVSDSVPFGGRAHRYGVCTSESAMAYSMSSGTTDIAGCDRIPVVTASAGLLAMLGAGIVLGRDAAEDDMLEGAPVVLISETLAARLFGTESAVGRHLYFGPGSSRVVVAYLRLLPGRRREAMSETRSGRCFRAFPWARVAIIWRSGGLWSIVHRLIALSMRCSGLIGS